MGGIFFYSSINSQNINSATNGLNKPTSSSVGIGGILNMNTSIDLGSEFTFRFKKSSSEYLFLNNAGFIGIGNALPQAKLHINGSGTTGTTSALLIQNFSGIELFRVLDNGNIGFGTNSPTEKLHVIGNGLFSGGLSASTFLMSSGAGSGKILTSDNNGFATWQYPTLNSWGLTGNAGTTAGINFIGTTDAQDLVFKTNNSPRMRITLSGRLAIYGPTTSIFIGNNAGNESSSGIDNTAIGYASLNSNTTAIDNTAIGAYSLTLNTTGRDNSAIGTKSMFNNTSGIRNVSIGSHAVHQNTTGNDNSVLGSLALYNNTTGSGNTAIGYYGMPTNTTGSYNTTIGQSADVMSNNLTNATAIGFNAKVSTSRSLVLGGTGPQQVNVGIGTTSPSARLELNSTTVGVSGLKFTQLTSSSIAAPSNGTQLTVDGSGNVILVSDIEPADGSETHLIAGSGITISGLGTSSQPYQLSTGGEFFWAQSGIGTGNISNLNSGGIIIGTGISSTPSGYKLYVAEGILTEKIKATLKSSTHWADHVFESDYKLLDLYKLEQFIKKHKHLPGIPSAEELVKEGGIDMNIMFAKQMEKIEELTIYMIELKKENDALKLELGKIKELLTNPLTP